MLALIRAVSRHGMDNPALAQLVPEWLVTSSWAETLRFILEHPDLADGRAKDLLAGLLSDKPEDSWLAERVELLDEVAQAGLSTLTDLAHPQRWRALYDREVDSADAGGLERMITWRAWLTGKNSPDDVGYVYVMLLLQDKTADARKLARAMASRPELVSATMEVLDRLNQVKPNVAFAGRVFVRMGESGSAVFVMGVSPETTENTGS